MAKWRPIDTRLWHDRKFLALGDDARLLWLYLLTSPSTISIPGVIVAGEGAMSEHLGWTVERFRTRISEIERSGVSMRHEGRLTWLPNALRYQPPSNPNAVKSWAKAWDDVPEGALKTELWQALKIACKSWSGLFAKGFREPLHDGYANRSANRYTQDQEQDQKQEQEQEQEQDQGAAARPAQVEPLKLVSPKPPKRIPANPDLQVAIDSFHSTYFAQWGTRPTWGAKQIGQLKPLVLKHGAGEVMRRIDILSSSPPAFLRGSPWDVGTLVQHFDKLAAPSVDRTTQTRQSPTETVLEMLRDVDERDRREAERSPFFDDAPHAAEVAS